MAEKRDVEVGELTLDLFNYRTPPQKSELAAIKAMIATSPDRFWALCNSLLEDDVLPTENIIVIRDMADAKKLIVREGNRRVAALKLMTGDVPTKGLKIPAEVLDRIAKLTPDWKKANSSVPCTIFEAIDSAKVDRIVELTHGKGEKAGRDGWNAVARARLAKSKGKPEAGLVILDKYLASGKNLTGHQRELWAGDFPLTVLDEAVKKLSPRLGYGDASQLAAAYPKISDVDEVDRVLLRIGEKNLGFADLRSLERDFAPGVPPPPALKGGSPGVPPKGSPPPPPAPKAPVAPPVGKKVKALASDDPKEPIRILKHFTPMGKNRGKLVTLRNEAILLSIEKTPHAFCFVLRAMFESSAKVYCGEQSIKVKDANGVDRKLVELLRDAVAALTASKTDKAMLKQLHGAITELAKHEGILSVTSLNQLVHGNHCAIPRDVARVFNNVFPLLEAMSS